MQSPGIAASSSSVSPLLSAVPTPARLCARFPLGARAASEIAAFRSQAIELVSGRSERLLAVVGPCSIHDPRAALDYAAQLMPLAQRYAAELFVVMRVYLEK